MNGITSVAIRSTDMMSVARRKVHSAWMDFRYGGRMLRGSKHTSYAHLGVTGCLSSGYDTLSVLFANQIRWSDVLVDVGSGKGRVLNWWLHRYRNHRIFGIEIDPAMAQQTRRRLRRFGNVTLITGDACGLIPNEGSLFYLYNPFNESVMRRFIATLLEAPLPRNGLPRRIIYQNCVHIAQFLDRPEFKVRFYGRPDCAVIDCYDVSDISKLPSDFEGNMTAYFNSEMNKEQKAKADLRA